MRLIVLLAAMFLGSVVTITGCGSSPSIGSTVKDNGLEVTLLDARLVDTGRGEELKVTLEIRNVGKSPQQLEYDNIYIEADGVVTTDNLFRDLIVLPREVRQSQEAFDIRRGFPRDSAVSLVLVTKDSFIRFSLPSLYSLQMK